MTDIKTRYERASRFLHHCIHAVYIFNCQWRCIRTDYLLPDEAYHWQEAGCEDTDPGHFGCVRGKICIYDIGLAGA